jgi:hypothetical protein
MNDRVVKKLQCFNYSQVRFGKYIFKKKLIYMFRNVCQIFPSDSTQSTDDFDKTRHCSLKLNSVELL